MDSKPESVAHRRRGGVLSAIGPSAAFGIALMASDAGAATSWADYSGAANGESPATVLQRIMPGVVSIETSACSEVTAGALAVRTGRKGGGRRPVAASRAADMVGSGVVFDAAQGLIMTNSHVIGGAYQITVKLTDGRALPAQRVGVDPNTDVAVIRVKAGGLTELSFADSDGIRVGDFVMAIGNPVQLGQTVTSGIVSGLHRSNVGIIPYEDFIQTDAAIYPGNSGGALVDPRGRLVGINTAYVGAAKGNPGLGFAIPANMARALANHILESGDIHRGTLGVVYEDAAALPVAGRGMPVSSSGAIIVGVDGGSAAERAGLKPGDLVVDLNGAPVRSAADFKMKIGLLESGDEIEFGLSRRGNRLTRRAVIAGRQATPQTRCGAIF